ncbi:MAG: GNAT family N-acetyltransferase [Arcanobacterium sp.]|nr:GNAT family N-acetyltransferase [Arcanobacterium sp.]
MKVHVVDNETELTACYKIRFQVFVDEQEVPAEEELDALDAAVDTIHLLLSSEDGVPLGTCRILPPHAPGVAWHIGRVAVLPESRGSGAGRKLMSAAHDEIFRHDAKAVIELSAQVRVIPFYESLGYEVLPGERFLDAGIWHSQMRYVGK